MNYDKLQSRYLQYQEAELKTSSYETLKARLTQHVEPFFKNEKLPIKPNKLIDFKTKLSRSGESYNYTRSLYTCLACVLNFGYRLYGIEPATRRVPNFRKKPRERMTVYTNDQYKKVRQKVRGRLYKTLFDVLFYGGLRRGEALALTPQDIDKNTITITKTFSRKRTTPPKTPSSVRRLTLPAFVIEELEAAAERKAPEERIFDKTSYTTIKRRLDEAAAQAGEKPIRVHDLRHSHITNLLYEGFTPQGIARRVGHSDTETLLNTYAEYLDGEDEKIAATLEKEIERKRNANAKNKKTPGS